MENNKNLGMDLRQNTYPICPHCGHEEQDAWEINFGNIEGNTKVSCGDCGKDYHCERHCCITYSTNKTKSGLLS